MNYSFEYIDIILLAMIAGFIFLRLRGILGKRTGFEGKPPPQFEEILKNIDPKIKSKQKQNFDENAQEEFFPSYPFNPVEDTGLPYHIIVSELSINGIEAAYDSEIAIFDGELCVGVGQYDPNNTIVVWGGDDNQSLQGFIQGNPIDIYVYHYLFNQWVLSSSDIDVIQGDGTFGNDSYSVLAEFKALPILFIDSE